MFFTGKHIGVCRKEDVENHPAYYFRLNLNLQNLRKKIVEISLGHITIIEKEDYNCYKSNFKH